MFITEDLAVTWRLLRGRKWAWNKVVRIHPSHVKTSDSKMLFLPIMRPHECNTLITNDNPAATLRCYTALWVVNKWLLAISWSQTSSLKESYANEACWDIFWHCRQIKPGVVSGGIWVWAVCIIHEGWASVGYHMHKHETLQAFTVWLSGNTSCCREVKAT